MLWIKDKQFSVMQVKGGEENTSSPAEQIYASFCPLVCCLSHNGHFRILCFFSG